MLNYKHSLRKKSIKFSFGIWNYTYQYHKGFYSLPALNKVRKTKKVFFCVCVLGKFCIPVSNRMLKKKFFTINEVASCLLEKLFSIRQYVKAKSGS